MTLLQVSDVFAGYGGGDVLRGVGLKVADGEIAVILGANGAGKTTLMRAISGTVERRGSIIFDGQELSKSPPESIVRRGIAHVPQGRGTIADLSVEDNLRAGAYVRKDKKEVLADMDRWYETYPRLAERRKQKAGLMSGGEQQMLAISRALMSRPRLLLCDEPSMGLSPKLTSELFESLEQINKETGMAILVVEQNATIALKIAARGYLIEVGTISASHSAAELTGDDAVRTAYLGY
jgi:branched-chain amino acid transport system ATP-binding protein